MGGIRGEASNALIVLAALALATACKSNSAARGSEFAGGSGSGGAAGTGGGGSGGTSGGGGIGGVAGSDAGGDACAPTAGAGGAVDMNGCPTAYVLGHYDAGTCGLCDPGESSQCSSFCDWAAAITVACSPDGMACAVFPSECGSSTCASSGTPECHAECDWSDKPACPALYDAAVQSQSVSKTCGNDDQCGNGYCDVRVDNRMFCSNEGVFYAKDYCPDAGTDSGADASDAGADAADGGT